MEAAPSEPLGPKEKTKKKRRRGAGSAAYAMQRRDADGFLFCHRSNGRAGVESSREGLLVHRERQCKAEREGLRECVEAVNVELQGLVKQREELNEERARLRQARHIDCCSAAPP